MSADSALTQIETLLAEIERLDRESGGAFRQASDREAFDTVCRIERRMQQSLNGAAKAG